MGSFTPLVLSTFGGMGGAATTVYKRLASLLSAKRDQSYGLVMSWLRCSISFSLLQSAITCLSGARSIRGSRCWGWWQVVIPGKKNKKKLVWELRKY